MAFFSTERWPPGGALLISYLHILKVIPSWSEHTTPKYILNVHNEINRLYFYNWLAKSHPQVDPLWTIYKCAHNAVMYDIVLQIALVSLLCTDTKFVIDFVSFILLHEWRLNLYNCYKVALIFELLWLQAEQKAQKARKVEQQSKQSSSSSNGSSSSRGSNGGDTTAAAARRVSAVGASRGANSASDNYRDIDDDSDDHQIQQQIISTNLRHQNKKKSSSSFSTAATNLTQQHKSKHKNTSSISNNINNHSQQQSSQAKKPAAVKHHDTSAERGKQERM